MSDLKAAYIMAALLIGSAIEGVLEGLLGDRLFHWSPGHGRFLVGQFAVVVRVPVLVVAYLVVPKGETACAVSMILALIIGLSSMAGVAVNRPIPADVVRPNHKATVFALVDDPISFGNTRTFRMGNANTLANALICLTVIPWSISFLLYGLLHLTYVAMNGMVAKEYHPEEQDHDRESED
ncbi:transmembrane domain-containing protein [Cyclospora cayetanensis]|uniref:Transmembrane domain-containing protein n=1 Tax=Cyclospora cayetanensis TaxID=88456 RepID=A0A1D3D880_9EIME|nr:transmembrane domain-containing protein [Cyclospora cayetanensis]